MWQGCGRRVPAPFQSFGTGRVVVERERDLVNSEQSTVCYVHLVGQCVPQAVRQYAGIAGHVRLQMPALASLACRCGVDEIHTSRPADCAWDNGACRISQSIFVSRVTPANATSAS